MRGPDRCPNGMAESEWAVRAAVGNWKCARYDTGQLDTRLPVRADERIPVWRYCFPTPRMHEILVVVMLYNEFGACIGA